VIVKITGIAFRSDAEVADIRVGADGTTYTSAGEAVRSQVSELKSEISYTVNGETFNFNETLERAGAVIKVLENKLPSDIPLTVTNNASNQVQITFRNESDATIQAVTFNANSTRVITLSEPCYSIRFYVNGTALDVDFAYGENVIGKIDDIKDALKIDVTLNDGYLNANGTIAQASATSKEKYTNKIKVFEGLKLQFDLKYLTGTHTMWNAVGVWKKDGTFSRVVFTGTSNVAQSYLYEPANDVESVQFTYRSYDDADMSIYVMSNSYDLYKTINNVKCSYAFDSKIIKGINHRGYNQEAPENTIPAYKLSVEHGFKFVETDVRFTSDNVPVLLHDATVDRTSDGTGNIADMTYAQVSELDFGSWKSSTYTGTKIPTLEEFIIFCKNTNIYPYLEMTAQYTTEQIKVAYDIIKKYGMECAVTWIGANVTALTEIVNIDPCARIGLITWGEPTSASVNTARSLMTGVNEVFLNLDITYASTAVSVAKEANIPLELWTSNSASAMTAIDPYVRGITSDTLNYETVMREYALS